MSQLHLNYLDENGELRFRPLRNCDLHTSSDVCKAARNAKFMFLKDCPEAETNGRNFYRQMCDWLLSPVREGYGKEE